MKTTTVVVAAVLAGLVSIGADAAPIKYVASLSGAAEFQPNASPGAGTTTVTFDDVAHTLRVEVTFAGLTGNTTASHIHCCTTDPFMGTAGVATVTPTFTGFPLGVTSGTYDRTYDLLAASGTWNPSFVAAHGGTPAGAEASLAAGLAGGQAYLNVHTNVFPGGEIRGFLTPAPTTPAPEPVSAGLFGLGLTALALRRRRRRS